jgi:hypothetical protein
MPQGYKLEVHQQQSGKVWLQIVQVQENRRTPCFTLLGLTLDAAFTSKSVQDYDRLFNTGDIDTARLGLIGDSPVIKPYYFARRCSGAGIR